MRSCALLHNYWYEFPRFCLTVLDPFVDEQFLGEFQTICRDYDMEPVCYGANMDRGLREDRSLNDEEMLDILDFTLTDNEMEEIAKLDKGVRYYYRTDEQLVQFAGWRPEFEKK